jgi:twitching motility protein PilJ
MEVLQAINKETANSTSATTESIRKLAELAAQLRQSVAGFRLPDAGYAEAAAQASPDSAPPPPPADGEELQYADQRTA